MNKLAGKIAAALCGMSLYASTALAMPDILPVAELRTGMTGTAYTVVDQSGDIRSFDVEIVGVLGQQKGASSMIIARASGPVVENAGGFLQGMSGSPVYVGGQLVGAGSATFKEQDPFVFLITPIEEMTRIWEMPDDKGIKPGHVVDLKEEKKKQEAAEKREAARRKAKAERRKAWDNSQTDGEAKDPSKADEKNGAPTETEQTAPETADAERPQPVDDTKAAEQSPSQPEQSLPEGAAPVPGADGYAKFELKEPLPDKPVSDEMPKKSLSASGFSRTGFNYLASRLSRLGYRAEDAFGQTADTGVDYAATLEPGSPIGVAVVYGDFMVGAMGTVTAVEDDKLLAFGHSFLHKGNTNYFLTEANILGTVNGLTDGMKLANMGRIIGRVNQDRESAVAGKLGEFPATVPVRITVEDATLNRRETFACNCAYDEDFLPLMAAAIPMSALSRVSDTNGEGTVLVDFTIQSNLLDEPIQRTNMFYAQTAPGETAFLELANLLDLMCYDRDREVDIHSLKINIKTEAARRTAVILSATPSKREVAPGEKITFKTVLKPYRGEKITLDIPFTVPSGRREGVLHLDLHGGALVQTSQLISQAAAAISAEMEKTATTADKVMEILNQDANNDIVIEPAARPPLMSAAEQKKAVRAAIREADEMAKLAETDPAEARRRSENSQVRDTFPTDYIIENVVHTSLVVKKKAAAPVAKETADKDEKPAAQPDAKAAETTAQAAVTTLDLGKISAPPSAMQKPSDEAQPTVDGTDENPAPAEQPGGAGTDNSDRPSAPDKSDAPADAPGTEKNPAANAPSPVGAG